MVTAGLDAEVIHRLAAWRTVRGDRLRRISRGRYLWPLAGGWWRYGYGQVELEVDGQSVRGTHAMVFNMAMYGPRWRMAPQARADSGVLEWVVMQRPGRVWALRYMMAAARGRLDALPGVRRGQAVELRLGVGGEGNTGGQAAGGPRGGAVAPLQADGDPLGTLPVTIRVVPGALRVVEMRPDG